MKRCLAIALVLLSLTLFAGCPRWQGPYPPGAGKDALSQYSTIDALLLGLYDGDLKICDLRDFGDFGLGTFNGLDGEMVVLDGAVYQVAYDGSVTEKSCESKTPFAAVTFFDADIRFNPEAGQDYVALQDTILGALRSPNLAHAIKLKGRFAYVKTRSVPKQSPPYRPLAEVVAEQSEFEFEDVEGTLVGYYLPAAMNHLNVPGFHCHFITKDRTAGGHILALQTDSGVLDLDALYTFTALFPENEAFLEADLESLAADSEGTEKVVGLF